MNTEFCSFTQENRFSDLVGAVQHCTLCPRLCNRTKVLSRNNGNPKTALLFVAEAPGRLGADRTGIPLCGDQSGDNFERLLGTVGWTREDIFITNAVLCNPREDSGNNGTPTAKELSNCSFYLEMTINVVNPAVIVTLGATALKALEQLCPHRVTLKDGVGKPVNWAGRTLVPLYHPGPRATSSSRLCQADLRLLAFGEAGTPEQGAYLHEDTCQEEYPCVLDGEYAGVRATGVFIGADVRKDDLLRLTKLLYLIDLSAIDVLGHAITGEIYLRQPDGPWPPALQKRLPTLDGMEIVLSSRGGIPMISPGPSPRFEPALDNAALEVVADIVEKYGRLNNNEIKTIAYQTRPMRYVLGQEKQGRNMRNFAIIYKDKAAPDTDESGSGAAGFPSEAQVKRGLRWPRQIAARVSQI